VRRCGGQESYDWETENQLKTINTKHETRMWNVEQGISNDEVKSFLLFPSAFVIRYSIFCGSFLNLHADCEEVFV